jgi:hypothetical protein
LRSEWFDGDQVLPEAVDLEGTSVNRHRYNPEPTSLISDSIVAVASVRPCDFPEPIKRAEGSAYVFSVFDCPDPDNQAHAEIRPIRDGVGWNANHSIAKPTRRLLKEALSHKMKILSSG